MATLMDTLEAVGSASAIWNEYEITVTPGVWDDVADEAHQGWLVRVTDFLATDDQAGRQHGLRPVVINNHGLESWDELAGVLAELGVPDDYEGWR